MNFLQMSLNLSLLEHLESVGFTTCTPVQEKVIPYVLDGKSVMAQAQTGTGKTAAFLIPILHYLIEKNELKNAADRTQNIKTHQSPHRATVLVISPTRELSMQIMDDAAFLGAQKFNIDEALLYGGGSITKQEKQLRTAQIIVATPGRLLDFCNKDKRLLSAIEYFVLDEADRLFDMGFYPDLIKIISMLPPQDKRRNLLFSATLSEKVRRMAYRDLNRPEEVEIPSEFITVDAIEQKLFHLQRNEKISLLIGMIKELAEGQTAIVFVNTKREVENLAERLSVNNIVCDYIMGDLPQSRRLSVIRSIKLGKVPVLIATDVAARGLHVNDLDLVVNYDLPEDPQNYVHRVGRTGRAGKKGLAVSFACDQYVFFLESIEELLGFKIPTVSYAEMQKISIPDFGKGSTNREVQKKGQAMMHRQRGTKPRVENSMISNRRDTRPRSLSKNYNDKKFNRSQHEFRRNRSQHEFKRKKQTQHNGDTHKGVDYHNRDKEKQIQTQRYTQNFSHNSSRDEQKMKKKPLFTKFFAVLFGKKTKKHNLQKTSHEHSHKRHSVENIENKSGQNKHIHHRSKVFYKNTNRNHKNK